MRVLPDQAAAQWSYANRTFYFCSRHCAQKFQSDPERYLQQPGSHSCCTVSDSASSTAEGSEYTCPMHPEIVQDHPGSCPLCGMALDPSLPTAAGSAEQVEQHRLRRLTLLAGVLSIPVVLLAMGPMLLSHTSWHEFNPADSLPPVISLLDRVSPLVQWLLSTAVVFGCGRLILIRAWQASRQGTANMFTLIAIGVLAAWGYSTLAIVTPGLFPPSLRDAHGQLPVYFESAAVIVTFVLLGQWLEARGRWQTGTALRQLLRLTPETARRLTPTGDEEIPLSAVRVGDRLRVRPGDRIPTDGIVCEGHGAVDESWLTGEALPVSKKPGDAVIGGTLNSDGVLIIEARRVGAATLLARIIQLVAEAQRSRPPIQRLADRIAARFVPAVLVIAVVTFAAWSLVGPPPAFNHALLHAIAVLIIACPCALGLATPLAVTVAVGRAATSGILIRSANALEQLAQVDILILDKTGTLTEGRPRLRTVHQVAEAGVSETDVLRWAAALESNSSHPFAQAILTAARERGLTWPATNDVQSAPGRGLRGWVEGRLLVIGTAAWVQEHARITPQAEALASSLRSSGDSVMYVAVDGQVVTLLAVTDPVRATAGEMIQQLQKQGIRLVMATGDNAQTAAAVARQLGITEFHAGLLPGDKVALIRRLQQQGHTVAMAGDGINDAPALSAADVGIALGHGADVALEAAPVVLVKGDLAGIVRARRLSQATVRIIRQNLFFAFFYNSLGLPLAAGLLVPLGGPSLHPMFAAAAMSLSSVSVIANALRLHRAI
ncbi:MAG: heavy metal translocating P-type ATPase, partial [Gemmataceae bacterium]|nr:heavy metal translocating P-type ATPase [Gemmataceae bacterium]